MTAPTVRAVPPPFRLHGLSRVRPVVSVVSVFVVMAALTVGYYVAVLGGFGNLSYVTVGIAHLPPTRVRLSGRRTCRSSSPATTAPT